MICDTSGLLAAFAADQPYHEECAIALSGSQRRLISPTVVTEIDHLARKCLGSATASRILEALAGPQFEMLSYTSSTLSLAEEVMSQYSDLMVDLVDASLVVHAREANVSDILTLDQRRFRAMRGLDGRHLRLIPFDID